MFGGKFGIGSPDPLDLQENVITSETSPDGTDPLPSRIALGNLESRLPGQGGLGQVLFQSILGRTPQRRLL